MGDVVVLGHAGLLCLKQRGRLQRVQEEVSSLMPLLESFIESYKIRVGDGSVQSIDIL